MKLRERERKDYRYPEIRSEQVDKKTKGKKKEKACNAILTQVLLNVYYSTVKMKITLLT